MKEQFAENTRLLFTESIQLTGIDEFGTSWIELTSGQTHPPAEGARFDLHFEGTVEGPEISGTIKGTDYMSVRADGRFMLDIYATITTEDGERIALYEDGILVPEGNGMANLQLNLKFTAGSSRYAWLNKMQVWAIARTDMSRGEVTVQAYTGDFYVIPENV